MEKAYDPLERVSTKQAAKELHIDWLTMTWLMRKGRLPIGYVMEKPGAKRATYIIYRGKLDKVKRQMAGEEEEGEENAKIL